MPRKEQSVGVVDAYIATAPEYSRPILRTLHEIVRSAGPELEEVIRWSCPCYKGRSLVVGFGAHKHHVRMFFFQGDALPDPDEVFAKRGEKEPERTLKLVTQSDIPVAKLRRLMNAAVKLDQTDRPKKPKARRPELPVPTELAAALERSSKAQQYFTTLPPSCRREYIEWIMSAKRAETRDRRIAETVDLLEAGRRMNDKYR